MSPEMIEEMAFPQSDIWSVGVIVYLMLTGKYPFDIKEEEEDLFYKIKNENYDLNPLDESNCSNEAKDFIQKCLTKDYKKRITTSECLEHPLSLIHI